MVLTGKYSTREKVESLEGIFQCLQPEIPEGYGPEPTVERRREIGCRAPKNPEIKSRATSEWSRSDTPL